MTISVIELIMKIYFTIILFLISLSGYTQKTLRDKNASYFYSYILDSIYKIYKYEHINEKITVSKRTNFNNIINRNNIISISNFNSCGIEIYKSLKNKYKIDSLEIINLKTELKFLNIKSFDSTRYEIFDNPKSQIILTAPIYFSDRKFALVDALIFNEQSGLFLFIKKNRKWTFLASYCEETY